MANELATAFAVTALGQTIAVFPVFLPRLGEVRKTSGQDPDMRGDVRLGEFAAAGISLTVGFTLSQLSGSPTPIITAAIMAGVIIAVYEMALNGERIAE